MGRAEVGEGGGGEAGGDASGEAGEKGDVGGGGQGQGRAETDSEQGGVEAGRGGGAGGEGEEPCVEERQSALEANEGRLVVELQGQQFLEDLWTSRGRR